MSARRTSSVRAELGRWVGGTLRAGTLAAMALVAIGYAWAVISGQDPAAAQPVIREIGRGGGDAVTALGLLTLTLVPIVVLGAAAAAFQRAGERRMAGVTAAVALLLLASLAIAGAIGAAI